MSGPSVFPAMPVHDVGLDAGAVQPELGKALCLSGGGYRAMLFHVGALWRLHDAGQLRDIKRFSSVSGGSITSAVLALAWNQLSFTPGNSDFLKKVVEPLRGLAKRTIDGSAIAIGALLPWSTAGERLASAYDDALFGGKTLQDLPDTPRFVFNATNVQSGALWRFSKPYMRDYKVGTVTNPTVSLAVAVAASSAFPPFLSPVVLDLDPPAVMTAKEPLGREPFTSRVVLSDGGVYDNLGMETAFKRYETILVSDGGMSMAPEAEPAEDWGRHAYRVLDLVDNQVRSLRKRLLIDAYRTGQRKGGYWGIGTDIRSYQVANPLPCDPARTRELAATPTRLARMAPELQERLINWGYAVCDAALRRHIDPTVTQPGRFPYPRGV